MRLWFFLVLILSTAQAAAARPTNAEMTRRLLGDALAPVLAAMEGHADFRGVGVKVEGSVTTAPLLDEFVADFLLDQGYEVWILGPDIELEEGALLLVLEADEASFNLGESQRGFLGLAAQKIHREAKLSFEARLSVPSSGQLLYDGAGAAQWSDWVGVDVAESPGTDDLLRSASRSNAAQSNSSAPPAKSWKERAVALGLLTGVILIYFSGAS